MCMSMDLDQTWYGWSTQGPLHVNFEAFLPDLPRGGSRVGQKYVKGVPFKKFFFRPEGYSNKPYE